MAQLTASQREAWHSVLDLVGLPRSAGSGSVRITGSEGCFSSKPGRNSLAVPHHVKLTSLDQARSLVGGGNGGSGESRGVPGEGDERQLRRGLFTQVVGRGEEFAGYGDVVSERFFPLQVIVYTGEDIEIKKGEVLTIEPDGHDPVVANYGTVILEQGGLIRCKAPVLFIVQRFIKKK